MYLETGQCAACRKIIQESQRHAPHNVAIDHLFRFKERFGSVKIENDIRPYFCSPEHIEKLLRDYAHGDVFKDPDDFEKHVVDEFKAKYGPDLKPYKRQINRHLKRLRKAKEQYDREELTRAWRELALDYHKARSAVIEEEKAVGENSAVLLKDYPINFQRFMEHTLITGSPGSGKTQLLQELFLHFLNMPDSPGMLVIDPKGSLIQRLAHLRAFDPVNGWQSNRLLILDAAGDTPLPLNMFAGIPDAATRDRRADAIDYAFSTSGQSLSPRMRPLFKFAARLLYTVPDATLMTFTELLALKEPGRFATYISKLDKVTKQFFDRDFFDPHFKETREQIRSRFTLLLTKPQILNSFCSKTSLDFGQLMAKRRIVLVNSALSECGNEASQLLGRYITMLVMDSALARGTDGPPFICLIDEFADYCDETATPRQLRLAREFNLGFIMAFQNLFTAELTDSLRSTISNNTAIKLASKPFGRDRNYILHDMGVDEAFLDRQVINDQEKTVQFACVVKGKPAVSIKAFYPTISEQDMMPETSYQLLLEINRHKLRPPESAPHTPPSPPPPPAPAPVAEHKEEDEEEGWKK